MKEKNEMPSNASLAILRRSSKKQEDNASAEVQEKYIRDYCKDKNLKLVRVESIIESAKNSDERGLYNALIDWAVRNKVKHVVFFKFDREARNLTDVESNEKFIKAGLLSIHYAADGKVFNENTPDSDFCMRDIQAAINKHYSRDLGTKVRIAMGQKAERGWFPSNCVPLGYMTYRPSDEYGRQSRGAAIVKRDSNERNVRQVQREFELFGSGLSIIQVRKQIIADGLIPADRTDTYWEGGIDRRVKDLFYRGYFRWNDIVYKGKHELIISTEILAKVDARFLNRAHTTQKDGIFDKGWLKCGDPACGCAIVFDPKKKTIKKTGEVKTYRYYHCTDAKRIHSSPQKNVSEDDLWRQFGEVINDIEIPVELASDIANALKATQETSKSELTRQVEECQIGLRKIDEQEDEFYRDLKLGILTVERYQRQLSFMASERRRLTQALKDVQAKLEAAPLETVQFILELATSVKSLWKDKTPDKRREDLNCILSNPRLDGTTVRFEIRKPFSTLLRMRQSGEWCRGPESNRYGP